MRRRGSLFLGLDVGTQGTKGLVIDAAARGVVARASTSYGLLEGLPPGAAEQHPATWWNAVCAVVRSLLADAAVDAGRVEGIGVSGQQHGLVALDSGGQVLRPAKLWCDTSTAAEARELSAALGRAVPTGYTASKILWLKRREPAAFARLAAVLLPHDYINYKLTGARWTEAGDASGSGLFDPVRRAYDEAAAAWIDAALPAMLPPLVAGDAPAGALSAEAAAELGLAPGIAIAPGGGDNMMSAIGSGAVRPGVCTVSLGTSATVFCQSPVPVTDPSGGIAPFCDSTGAWLPLLCVMNATGVLEEVRAAFASAAGAAAPSDPAPAGGAAELGSAPEHAAGRAGPRRGSGLASLPELTRAAEQVEIGCGGLLLLPYLVGERVPDLPSATAALLGLRPGLLRPGTLFRAALEGTSLNLGWGVERMRALGLSIEQVRLVGGASRSELWQRILAAVLQVPVQPMAEPESAALGAALQALWVVRRAAGSPDPIEAVVADYARPAAPPVLPDPAAAEAYAALGARFRAAVQQLWPGA